MKGNIDLSFCIPVYNAEKYLKECIEAVYRVSEAGINIEIIAVDDCSTDHSYEILKRLQQSIPQLKILKNKENKGVSYTRNKMLEICGGGYIAFVDADDLINFNAYIDLYNSIVQEDAEAIFGNIQKISENTKLEDCLVDIKTKNCYVSLYPNSDMPHLTNCISPVILKGSLIRENNIRFKQDMVVGEDTVFNFTCEVFAKKILKKEIVCYYYRQTEISALRGRKSEEKKKKIYKSHLQMLITYLEFYDKRLGNKMVLQGKIHHSKENVAFALVLIHDKKYVQEQLNYLKKIGCYPYPLRKKGLESKENFVKKWILFLLPFRIWFWGIHFILKILMRKNKKM